MQEGVHVPVTMRLRQQLVWVRGAHCESRFVVLHTPLSISAEFHHKNFGILQPNYEENNKLAISNTELVPSSKHAEETYGECRHLLLLQNTDLSAVHTEKSIVFK